MCSREFHLRWDVATLKRLGHSSHSYCFNLIVLGTVSVCYYVQGHGHCKTNAEAIQGHLHSHGYGHYLIIIHNLVSQEHSLTQGIVVGVSSLFLLGQGTLITLLLDNKTPLKA